MTNSLSFLIIWLSIFEISSVYIYALCGETGRDILIQNRSCFLGVSVAHTSFFSSYRSSVLRRTLVLVWNSITCWSDFRLSLKNVFRNCSLFVLSASSYQKKKTNQNLDLWLYHQREPYDWNRSIVQWEAWFLFPKLVFNLPFFLLRRKRCVLAKKMNATARMWRFDKPIKLL